MASEVQPSDNPSQRPGNGAAPDAAAGHKPRSLSEESWRVLLTQIEARRCTPFLGAGINYGLLPLGGQLAKEWADREKYPFVDSTDLARVAQFLAIKYKHALYPKTEIIKRLRREPTPDFKSNDAALHSLKAISALPIPVYVTTNYDDLLSSALKHQLKVPRIDYCRWNKVIKKDPSVLKNREAYTPDEKNPLVFHLHGHWDREHSLVLSEDDYLDFLVNISRDEKIMPPRIREALADCSVLFLGYRLKDINFRVIYRWMVQSLETAVQSLNISVQIHPPDDYCGDVESAAEYLAKYLGELKVDVYWGTAAQFLSELTSRWSQYLAGNTSPASTNAGESLRGPTPL